MKNYSEQFFQNVRDDVAPFLRDDPFSTDIKNICAKSLLDSIGKKFLYSGETSAEADRLALNLFRQTNDGLLSEPREAESDTDRYLLGEVKASLDRFWFASDVGLVQSFHDIFENGRPGPGASLGAKKNDFYTKLFDSTLSTSNYRMYNSYIASLSRSSYLHTDAEYNRRACWGSPELVEHSKLLFVPKRSDISRTICVEPNLNMYYQLGLGRIIEARLREVYGLNLSTQPDFNRELSRKGSIDGSYATIDLSSASDSLSIGVLKKILPAELFLLLEFFRTPSTLLPDGSILKLNMISTMGNGFTFPLETLIFSSIVEAAYRLDGKVLKRNTKASPGNWAVFGDDIIVEASCYNKVCRLLYLLGFTVNRDKTFFEGPFRESCGADYFEGQNVRGVYIKTLRTPQDRYVAINLLNRWTAKTGIPLSKTIQHLLKTVKRVLVPPSEGLEQGIHVPLSFASPGYNTNGSFRIKKYVPVPLTIKVDACTFNRHKANFNPSGLELAACYGAISSGRISRRQRDIRFRLKGVIVPNWGTVKPYHLSLCKGSVRWETAVHLNLFG